MLLRIAAAALALQVSAVSTTWACEGQKGKVIFEDNFADDSGGWELSPPSVTIKPPAMLLALDQKIGSTATQNLTFHATDGDFCIDVILPKPTSQDNTMSVGLEFWATDYNNLMLLQVSTVGTFNLYSHTNGAWQVIFSIPSGPAFKAEPGAVNSIRVVVKAEKLTTYLNNSQMKVIRAQMPEGNLRFGVYGQFDKNADNSPPIQITGYRVTAGE
jgi:hypothetical protein